MKKRVLALLICACMLVGMVPVFATEVADEPNTEITDTVENDANAEEQAPDASEPETEGSAQLPVEPEQPTEPAEPEVPVEPEKPAEPEVPVEPEKPAEPEAPVEPEKPTEPEVPVEPEKPAEPEVPVEPEVPTDPANPEGPGAGDILPPEFIPGIPLIPAYPIGECTCGAEGEEHLMGCPLFQPTPVREMTDGVVTVSGNIPAGVYLEVEDFSDMAYLPMDEVEQSPLARLNVTLYKPDGTEWQPEQGEPVTVTLNAAELGLEDGHDYVVSHIHVDEETEEMTTTNFCAVPEEGEMTFELPGFSYILVFEGQQSFTLPDIDAFYTTSDGVNSVNDHLQFLGIYYDTSGNTHFLVATTQAAPDKDLDKIESVTVDGVVYQRGDVTLETYTTSFITAKFMAKDSDEVLETVTIKKGKVAEGFVDFNVGNVQIGKDFSFAVNGDQSGQGWQIGGSATVNIDYTLTKEVAKGASEAADFADSITVERGDTIIYRITIVNGKVPLHGMSIKDILPENVFVNGGEYGVKMSIDDPESGVRGEWEPFSEDMFGEYESAPGATRHLYILATVDPNLQIKQAEPYVNEATINGMNMPETSDTATITVNPPKKGVLTVKKVVVPENPMDEIPNDEFEFMIHSDAEADSTTFTYTIDKGTELHYVTNGETFILKHNQTAYFDPFPVGDFTISEMPVEGYVPSVDNHLGPDYEGTMDALDPPTVSFSNLFSTRFTGLKIKKVVEKAYTNDVLPNDEFTFEVLIGGEGIPENYFYSYTTTDGEHGIITAEDNTITLNANQTATIHNIPVGAAYTVTEDLAADYELKSITGGNIDLVNKMTSGTLTTADAELTFTNTYKKHLADLTITKTGAQEIDENQSFVFHVTGPDGVDLYVTIQGNDSKTIKDLPVGTYTVTEETSWSWRYDLTKLVEGTDRDGTALGNNQITLPGGVDKVITAVNMRTADNKPGSSDWKWLNGNSYAVNRWNADGTVERVPVNQRKSKRKEG